MFGMGVVGVQCLLDISMIGSWRMLILCLGGFITTLLFRGTQTIFIHLLSVFVMVKEIGFVAFIL